MKRYGLPKPEHVTTQGTPKATSGKSNLIGYMRANVGTKFTSPRGIVGVFYPHGLLEPLSGTIVPYEGTDERKKPSNDYQPNRGEWLTEGEINGIMRDGGKHMQHPEDPITKQEYYRRTGRKLPEPKEIIPPIPEPARPAPKEPGPACWVDVAVPDELPPEIYEDPPF